MPAGLAQLVVEKVWTRSGAGAGRVWNRCGAGLDQMWSIALDKVRDQVSSRCGPSVDQMWSSVVDQRWSSVVDQMSSSVVDQMSSSVVDQMWTRCSGPRALDQVSSTTCGRSVDQMWSIVVGDKVWTSCGSIALDKVWPRCAGRVNLTVFQFSSMSVVQVQMMKPPEMFQKDGQSENGRAASVEIDHFGDVADAEAVYRCNSKSGTGVVPPEKRSMLQSICYLPGSLQLLDQRKLPRECVYLDIKSAEDAWHAIVDMAVRGAPAIAIAAALSLAVELANSRNNGSGFFSQSRTAKEVVSFIESQLDYLGTSRPTAVNLFEAIKFFKREIAAAADRGITGEDIVQVYVDAAERMLEEDVKSNMAIGDHGAQAICEDLKVKKGVDKFRILTHCNTGSLATAGYGTALGVIRSLHRMGKLEAAICTETRPYNQGSRLTAFELVHDGIPALLVADSAVASLKACGRVDAVVVGADRVAANGDTANKIGTYAIALSAFHHGIPFYVAAPFTTVDLLTHSGTDIHIEERSPKELTHSHGGHGTQVAPSGIDVWNPAFDVTPAQFIAAILTDKGVIRKPRGLHVFDISYWLRGGGTARSATAVPSVALSPAAVRRLSNPSSPQEGSPDDDSAHPDFHEVGDEFEPLDGEGVRKYVGKYSELSSRVGGDHPNEWTVREVGDGNINFVYIVEGPRGGIIVKQSLPYVRCVGDSWPLTLERSYFEVEALKEHGRICPEHVPEVYHENPTMAVISERYCEHPHIILRKGLIAGVVYPLLSEHMGEYLSRTLFFTSLFALSSGDHKKAVAKYCKNSEMCRLTEQVVFTEPYMNATNNRWTSPQLDEDALRLRKDRRLKLAVAELKSKFCERAQALIHGDLHTGSIMVTQTSTQVIDPEFAFYGPMGFDLGAYFGNLMLSYFSQDGHPSSPSSVGCPGGGEGREGFKAWLLQLISETWSLFSEKFRALWRLHATNGHVYNVAMFPTAREGGDDELSIAQEAFMQELLEDTLGFASAKMIRRIVGIAHVADFEEIHDPDVRAVCERRALNFAKSLLIRRKGISSMEEVVQDLKKAS
ncbi:hypothetical protein CBR_g23696 [Chara braunii]|uniref:Methylthioribose-1-phosphate isomerase n=1 Tax=Chara braunii TaxID=69332 RepID=A0A388L4Y5_CHABU|nr:hypothetical protein CBR_g23696 [Chara braunii]|eukprot:GBG77364.1 hypothetical protein CBR_g23696 [Chara braunii]